MDLKVLITFFIVVAVFFLSINQNFYEAEAKMPTLSKEEDLELEKQLKILNKPPIKIIHAKFGDTFDCVDIYKQPALDHPLLKNHKIQMEQNLIIQKAIAIDNAASSITKVSKMSMLGLDGERCPSGTVPIRRTKKEDLINAKHLSNLINRGHYAYLEVHNEDKVYYGGRAKMGAYNPSVNLKQFSTSQIWLQNGPAETVNSIEFGWAVYPLLFGDNATRIFVYWTADGYKKTGCFNILCPGFVQVNPGLPLGTKLSNYSVYGGKQQFITPIVHRDPLTHNWWLSFNSTGRLIKVGYWPKELFTHLASNASVIRYGGLVGAEPGTKSPPMGNGEFPDFHYLKSSFMSNLKVMDDHGVPMDIEPSKAKTKNDCPCYLAVFYPYEVYKGLDFSVSYGGVGDTCYVAPN